MSRALLGVSLLLCVGCAGARTAQPLPETALPPTLTVENDGAMDESTDTGIQAWIPNIFHDLWDTIDADIGAGYGFGMRVKATNFLRLGIFDMSDFGLLGIERPIFEGEWLCPWQPEGAEEGDLDAILDLSAEFGMGVGAGFTLHTWQVIDLFSTLVGFGYWSLEGD